MSLNPWLALILGILFGWFFGWLLERWFFRRRRVECEEQLTRVEGELRAQQDALNAARTHAGALEADLAALKLAAEASQVTATDIEAELPELDLATSKLEAAAPEVEIGAPVVEAEFPEIELPEVRVTAPKVDIALPEVTLPEVEIEVEGPKVRLPGIDLPDVDLDALKGKVTGGLAAVGAGLAGLVGREREEGALDGGQIEAPEVEETLPPIDFDRLSATVAVPELALPEVELAAPQVEVELPEIELAAPRVEVELPEVTLPEVALPEVELEAPQVELGAVLPGVTLPEVELEAPQVELGLPETVLPTLEVAAPQVEIKLPEVALPEVELEAPQAELGAALPGVALPEIELEVRQVEIELPGVTLPEVELEAPKAEVDWPALAAEVGQVEVEAPEVSISAPSIGVELPTVEAGLPEAALPEAAVEVLTPTVGARADDLTLIKGIGPKFAAQLSAAGITSFGTLAAADPAQLKAVIDAPEWRQVDFGAWVADAQTLAAAASQAAGDDLTRLEGIGPAYAARLNAAGIMTFADLATADETRLSEIIAAPGWRKVNYGEWIEQARLAAAGDAAGLAEIQARLFSRSGDNLTLVSGVGEKAAQALGAAGITSFAALAAASPERLADITRTAGVRSGDFDAWIAEAGLRAAGKRISKPKQVRAAKVVSCPQDLSRIKGIGTVFETKLYAAGVGTFWELSETSSERLAEILEVKDFQKVDLGAIKVEALRLAEETGTLNRTWDGTPPDDFEPFEGIGEVYEGRLYDAGICTYRALATASVEQLAEICKAPEWRRPDYASWIAQARRLIEG